MMFDLRKIFNLRKIFAVPKDFLKSKNYFIPIKIFLDESMHILDSYM